eukprot:3562864-Pyramimonas_sp.AAC.1
MLVYYSTGAGGRGPPSGEGAASGPERKGGAQRPSPPSHQAGAAVAHRHARQLRGRHGGQRVLPLPGT